MSRKKKKNRNPIIPKNDDYDLKKSLGKLNQRKTFPESETSTNFEINKSQSANINSQSINENLTSETNIYFKLTDNINSRYDSLNKDLKSVSEKITDSNDNLRQELESKVSEKLDKNIFFYAIAVLLAITSLIYALSYSGLLNDTKENSTEIKQLKSDVKNQNEAVEDNKKDIEKLEEKQDKLEIELIKKEK
ncbi:hypothetical protein DIS18_12275 [Algibacter marinivivus]|uniref:Uncharacterized protein n=1 Tax=Algibacter marinivivus TaxID=2100723 RepID=A0A2U2X2P2_9FLAO|nr:hypothetical protein [Algibacter marinivivus]PWH82037.1 hypothetical protein DIS18_12275 [Algibacter marinivivus]